MRQIFLFLTLVVLIACNNETQKTVKQYQIKHQDNSIVIPIILSKSLENRKEEFDNYLISARKNISNFAKKYNWSDLVKEEFIDSMMIFDIKKDFNKSLLILAEADTNTKLPDTYCAALEKRTLVVVSPEYYAKVFPEGIEQGSFEKLLTHEIAHRLHIKILNGNEEEMGPIWFYEGFAMFVANQFSNSKTKLSKKEMTLIMNDPNRGSYMKYNYIFRYFVEKISLTELISKAKNKDFNKWLISKIN